MSTQPTRDGETRPVDDGMSGEDVLTDRWHQEQIDLALEWLLLFQAGESQPLPGDNWIPVAIDALRLCGAVSGSRGGAE